MIYSIGILTNRLEDHINELEIREKDETATIGEVELKANDIEDHQRSIGEIQNAIRILSEVN